MKDSSAEIISLHVETRCETQVNYKICLKSAGLCCVSFLVGFVFCCLRHITIEKKWFNYDGLSRHELLGSTNEKGKFIGSTSP